MSHWWKALALWCLILVLAVLNGLLRERVLIPSLGIPAGLVASGLLLIACIFLVALASIPWIGRRSARGWLRLGAFWVFLTLVFEFCFGLAQGKSWSELFAAYTFQDGNIWPLVLLTSLLAPWCAAKVRRFAD